MHFAVSVRRFGVADVSRAVTDYDHETVADGMPDSYIQEPVLIGPVCRSIPGYAYTDAQHHDAFLKAQKFFHSQGFTLLSDCMEEPQEYGVIRKMAKNGELKIRLHGVHGFNDETREEDLKTALGKMGQYDVDDIFTVNTAKYFADGDFAMLRPYEASYCREKGLPEGTGTIDKMLWDVEHLRDSMEKAQKAGLNIHVHSFGDLSTRLTIDCMIHAQKNDPEHKCRNIIAHCAFVNDEDKKRMAENGIIASIQPQWQCENAKNNPSMLKQLGKERFYGIYPNKSLLDAGVICAYGSDFTVNYLLPLEGISSAMTRKEPKTSDLYETFKNEPALSPEECVTLKDTIKGWTIAPAYQFHREDITGSIKAGKSAELILLDGDIEKMKPEDICLLKVKETVFKGLSVYKA